MEVAFDDAKDQLHDQVTLPASSTLELGGRANREYLEQFSLLHMLRVFTSHRQGAQQTGGQTNGRPGLHARGKTCYCPVAAGAISNGRLNSITNSVPASKLADFFFPSQCTTVAVAPMAPPITTPLPPPASPPITMPPPVAMPISVRSWPSCPRPLNSPSLLTLLPSCASVCTSDALSTKRCPSGITRASGIIPMVGRPEIRRGSLNWATLPCTVAPTGITVLPSSDTASVIRAENGSPVLLERVAILFSSLTVSDVPVGSEILFCAIAISDNNSTPSNVASFLMEPPSRCESAIFNLKPSIS